MGASIGLGLRAAGWQVSGWDPDPEAAVAASRKQAIDRILDSPDDSVDTDVLVLAGPPSATIATLIGFADSETVVTDIASVKTPVVEAGREVARFVPGHPMAGASSSGAEHASAHLFHGAAWVLCDDLAAPQDMEVVKGLVSDLGANPVVMSAQDHDRRVALVSHLPRVLASTLIELAQANPDALQLSAGSFRDLTRVAGSDSIWWTDVLMANREAMVAAVEEVETILARWKADLGAGEAELVAAHLEGTRSARTDMGESAVAVRVILFDKPGEIAKVGRALEVSAVDLRDLHIRHAEYGGGGVLTLSVATDEAGPLRAALDDLGFEIEA